MQIRSGRRPILASIVLLTVTAASSAWSARAGALVTVEPASSRASVAAQANAEAAHRLGLPPGGPDVLYEPPPNIPELQNRDPRFHAAWDMVSGTERYIDREYEYTDFLYDDTNYTYPDNSDPTNANWKTYGGNCGDLAEFRISARDADNLAFRFTLNTLMVPNSTIIALAFDSDNNANTGSSTLPRDPGMPFPGTDQVLTTWGTGAEWSRWTGAAWKTVPLDAQVDTDANQITVTLPKSVADPTGKWRATLATGLYDPSTGGWLDQNGSSTGSKIINLGFRFGEIAPPAPRELPTLSGPPTSEQQSALTASQPTQLSHLIDFDLLRSGREWDNIPQHGMLYRIFASRNKTVLASSDGNPTAASGHPMELGEGEDTQSVHGRYLSPLQPYALYVPAHYQPGHPAPLAFFLHGDGGQYDWLNDFGSYADEQLGEARNGLVLSPAGRGYSGFYVGDHENDLFEAWNDVARNYTLDPTRTVASGYSMGGYGTLRLALLWPSLFARAVAMSPALCDGIWTGTVSSFYNAETVCNPGTLSNYWLQNARNLPIFQVADTASELTFYPAQVQQVIGPAINGLQSLDSLGYRYKFWTVTADHEFMGTNFPAIIPFVGHYQVEPEPFHVTFSRMPSSDYPKDDLHHDSAYWLSGIEVRDASAPLARGVVDAVSLGFGKSDPTSQQTYGAGITSDPTSQQTQNSNAGPTALAGFGYAEVQRTWNAPRSVPVQDKITINAINIKSLTIDPVAAHVDCNVQLDVHSDGPITVYLLGCG